MIKQEAIETVKKIIEGVVLGMGIKADIEVREQPDTIVFNLRTEDSHMLIGQHGVNLAALQYICRIMARRQIDESVDFVIDIDDYKKKREAYLSNLAQRVYKEVTGNHKAVVLRPMSSYERRFVHAALSAYNDVSTDSIGEDPERMVTVKPAGSEKNISPQDVHFNEQEDFVVID